MYVDPIVFHAVFALAATPSALCLLAAYVLHKSHRHGGLTFCRLGRLGFSFYLRRA
jgi:lipopolysaccharide export LptBFGC system permease protein LptF